LTLDLPGAIIPPFAAPACSVVELPICRRQLPVENEVARENSSANADIAQLVEQVIRNDQVVGSNPTIGSNSNHMNAWDLSTVPNTQIEKNGFGRKPSANPNSFCLDD
jgi:hypothetical protein